MTIEIQCTSCHTRYRIDEQVLPEGTPTFKCSRCGHVFSFEPRAKDPLGQDPPD
ncbi:MAG: zinc-ribbon domain-containing protein, partial [Candidatus Binataceae bacterium]